MATPVSVVIPTVGRIPHLENCLSSLFRQTHQPDEIVIIDNSLNRRAQAVLNAAAVPAGIPVRYRHEPRPGAAYARNTGMRLAKNDLVAFIDDDCVAEESWLGRMITAYEHSGKEAVIQGVSKNGLPDNFFAALNYFKDELFLNSGFFMRKKGVPARWFDSKNFLASKSFFLRYRLRFRHYLIFQDLDLTIQMVIKKIPIATSIQAVVYHYGRADLRQSLKKWIMLGVDRYDFHRSWFSRGIIFYTPQHKRQTDREKTVERRLLNRLFKKKGAWYRWRFRQWFRFSIFVTETSFAVTKFLHRQ